MLILKQKTLKKVFFFFSILLFGSFLFFLPEKVYASDPVFSAGWYLDHGGHIEPGEECNSGLWQAHIEFRNAADGTLLDTIDKLDIKVSLYKKNNTVEPVYGEEVKNLEGSFYKTGCVIETRGDKGEDTIVLYVKAETSDFYHMIAANSPMEAGDTLSRATWKKTLYLASNDTAEWNDANIAFMFPRDGHWVSNEEGYEEMELFVRKASGAQDINEIKTEITNLDGEIFTPDIDVGAGIAEGTVKFVKPHFEKQGEYAWRITSMKSGSGLYYNENAVSKFHFDSVPPYLDERSGRGVRKEGGSVNDRAPRVLTRFKEHPPYSGVHKIEIYLDDNVEDDNLDKELKLRETCTTAVRTDSLTCEYIGEYREYEEGEEERFTYYFIAYDQVGNKIVIQEYSFWIRYLDESTFTVRSLASSEETGGIEEIFGIDFEVTNANPLEPDFPATGTYQTVKIFYAPDDYRIWLEAPPSYNDKPFSFWRYPSTCHPNRVLDRTVSAGSNSTSNFYFGATRFGIFRNPYLFIDNLGTVKDSLRSSLWSIETKVTQEGGNPENLLPEDGFIFPGSITRLSADEYEDFVLLGHDSDCGILLFSRFRDTYGFCEEDPDDWRKCIGQLTHADGCASIYPMYFVKRTVRVETYLGVSPIEGITIEGEEGMEPGTTAAEGYYEFSSTGTQAEFSGTLWADSTIIVGEEEFEFGEWNGCQQKVSRPGEEEELGCYIGTDKWYDYIAVTVEAHYAGLGEDPEVGCADVGLEDGDCGPADLGDLNQTPYWCEGGVARRNCDDVHLDFDCRCPSGYVCITSSDGVCVPIYNLSVGSSPVNGFSVTSSVAGHESFTTTYNMPDILEGTVVSLTVEPEQTIGGDTYHFINWTDDEGTIITTDPTCQVTMDSHKTVTANYSIKPIAAMECDIEDCRGPGCICDNDFNLDWETFHNSDVRYHLINKSTSTNPAIDIISSHWSIGAYNDPCTGFPLCNITIPFVGISIGTHNIILEVEDAINNIASTSHQIIIKRDVSADFDCSLDGSGWESCDGLVLLTDQEVYFRGDDLLGGLSRPSDGAGQIIEWLWEKGDGTTFEEFAYSSIASTTVTGATSIIRLTVTDNHPADLCYPPSAPACQPEGRSAEGEKTLNVRLPLPEYREVRPRSQLDNFLARLGSIFAGL